MIDGSHFAKPSHLTQRTLFFEDSGSPLARHLETTEVLRKKPDVGQVLKYLIAKVLS
jgi:hypothetical protein